ncbi:MAG: M24 family metallopeptidase, partial [Myxococcales bacterium]|nr:M24 family metallopeptidase [Myxococcales bacterium]
AQHGEALENVPAVQTSTRHHKTEQLGRPWGRDLGVPALQDQDAALADALVELRACQDSAGLELMREAVGATRAGHLAGMAVTAPGKREHEIRAAIEREFLARDMDCAYGSIVTVHGEVLHNDHHGHELHEGDLLLADAGAEHCGWASDITRTWPVTGKFSATQRAIYDIVLQAQCEACDRVRPGMRYRDLHLGACVTIT